MHGKSKKHKESENRCACPKHWSTKTADHFSILINNLDENSELLGDMNIRRTKCMASISNVIAPSLLKDLTTYIGLMEINTGNAATLVDILKTQFIKYFLPLENLIGIGGDRTKVMVGQNNSVSTILKNTSNQELVTFKCVCHSLQLASEHAFKLLPTYSDFHVRESHNSFSLSSKC
ncbi:hypothetical protein PV325_005069 [Microctonus aethiopoides]|nr:hypothetical protein PV325_005069 [Microctonus aethiopoides]